MIPIRGKVRGNRLQQRFPLFILSFSFTLVNLLGKRNPVREQIGIPRATTDEEGNVTGLHDAHFVRAHQRKSFRRSWNTSSLDSRGLRTAFWNATSRLTGDITLLTKSRTHTCAVSLPAVPAG